MAHAAGGADCGEGSGCCGNHDAEEDLPEGVLFHVSFFYRQSIIGLYFRPACPIEVMVSRIKFVEGEGSCQGGVAERQATLLACHCFDEDGPVGLRQPLHSAVARPVADVIDVAFRIVFGRRCPAGDDVANATKVVLAGIGAEDAEGGSEAPLHSLEPDEPAVVLQCRLSFPPQACNSTDVQRVVILLSTIHRCLLKIKD